LLAFLSILRINGMNVFRIFFSSSFAVVMVSPCRFIYLYVLFSIWFADLMP
jgi:hypothetical protein